MFTFVITASDSPGIPLFCCLNPQALGAPSALGELNDKQVVMKEM